MAHRVFALKPLMQDSNEPSFSNWISGGAMLPNRPQGASKHETLETNPTLKSISEHQVGDEVLGIADWKDKGNLVRQDQHLSCEIVTDIFTCYKEQTLVYPTLENGEQLTAKEGHPCNTFEGWRDAPMLKKGGKLLLKRGDTDSEPLVEVKEISFTRKTLPVYNIEVYNAYTYYVGVDGVGVHNQKFRVNKKCYPLYNDHAYNKSPSN